MNKVEMIKTVATATEMTQKGAGEVVDAVFAAITDALVEGDTVAIPGFGKFVSVEKEATTARNPKTGDPVDVPAHNVVRFKVSSVLKETVR